MPNIEIHGTNPEYSHNSRRLITSLLKDVRYRDGVVVSVVNNEVTNLDGKPQPFLRVIFSKNEPTGVYDDCVTRLSALNMDIEVVVIEKFIPKKE